MSVPQSELERSRPIGCPATTVLICALDEEGGLPHVLPRIPGWVDEVIVVDGNSTDRTVEVVGQLCTRARILYQPGNGKGNALRYGVENATGEIVVTLDADGQTDPARIDTFIAPLLDGYDFAKGSRLALGRPSAMPRKRWFGNRAIAATCNVLLGTDFTDLCSGYNAFWRDRLLRIHPWDRDDWNYEPLLIARALKGKLRVTEVPYDYEARVSGSSKLPDWRQGLSAIKVLIRERFFG